jgi:hypothetical protein
MNTLMERETFERASKFLSTAYPDLGFVFDVENERFTIFIPPQNFYEALEIADAVVRDLEIFGVKSSDISFIMSFDDDANELFFTA